MKPEFIRDLAFCVLLGSSTVTDLTTRKIYNYITLPAMVFGMASAIWHGGWDGFFKSSQGVLAGVAFLLPLVLTGGMGGGDLKLLAAVGALEGYPFVLEALLYSSVCGGVMALWALTRAGRLVDGLKNCVAAILRLIFPLWPPTVGERPTEIMIPYGVAIAVGSGIAYLMAR